MTNLNRFYLLLITIFLTTNCSISNSKEPFGPRYAMELLDGDNSDLYECALLIKLGGWEPSTSRDDVWGRNLSLRYNNGVTQLETGENINYTFKNGSSEIQQNNSTSLIYIGKWHHVKKIGKDIRLIGYQNVNNKTPTRFGFSSHYGEINHQFETRTPENEKIKEMKFTLSVIPKNTHKQDSECSIKWYDKYGYNAIVETKRVWARGIWGKLMLKHELIVTGKVIQAEE